jgi:KDO2-lipid IV(A) lauroyltransferase
LLLEIGLLPMKLIAIRVSMRIFSWFPPRMAEFLAPALAALVWYSVPRLRRTTRLNLATVYPHLDAGARYRIGRQSMVHYARGVFEAGMLWHWPLERIFDLFDEPRGKELFEAVLDDDKGFILGAPHFGAWEMLNLYLHKNTRAIVLYKPTKYPEVDELLQSKRSRAGAEMVPVTGAGLRKMFKSVQQGWSVSLLPDQEPTAGNGEFAPFFGVEALTGVLLPRLARRTGAPVIFSVCERRPGGRYRVHYVKPDDRVYSENMREALTAVNQAIEQCISVDTSQYLWAYKRFRNRPEGEPSIYKRKG